MARLRKKRPIRPTQRILQEDEPGWDWKTMGNKQRGIYSGGRWQIQHADGSITDTHPNPTLPYKPGGAMTVPGRFGKGAIERRLSRRKNG